MFIDTATIYIRAGNGGDGAVSFHREKYVAAGGPDGGDGGRGGNVVFVPDDRLNTLADFRYRRKFLAENGQPGSGKRCSGKSGADLTIRVPRGTLIYDNKSGRLMADLSGMCPSLPPEAVGEDGATAISPHLQGRYRALQSRAI